MSEIDQVMRRVGFSVLLVPLLIGLPIALFTGGIDVPIFLAVATVWLFIALVLVIGPESISEISFGKAKIKREVKAAVDARNEAEAIRDDLRETARLQIENTYVLMCLIAPLYKPDYQPLDHMKKNLEKLTPLVAIDHSEIEAWQARMRDLVRGTEQNRTR